jgi:hypothetical protein
MERETRLGSANTDRAVVVALVGLFAGDACESATAVDNTRETVLRMEVTTSVIGQHASKTALVEHDMETDLSQEGAMDV